MPQQCSRDKPPAVKTTGPNAGMAHWQSPDLPTPQGNTKKKAAKSYLKHRPELTRVVTRQLWDHWKQSGKSKRALYKAAAAALSADAAADIADPIQAVQRHIERLLNTGINEDAPRPGRPSKLTEAQTRLALKAFKNGYTVADKHGGQGHWFGFGSWEHALLENCTGSDTLRRILCESGMTVRSMFDALERANGGRFKKIHIRYTYKCEAAVRKDRLAKSKVWAELTEEELTDVIWIDEKTEWVHGNRTYICYAPDDAEHETREGIMKFGMQKRMRYMSAASARFGPVYFAKVSGCDGYETPFEVRTCVP